MPGKRKAVSAALHSELTEYASLIRALRTSDTLDLSAQLLRSHRRSQEEDHYEDDPEDTAEGLRLPSTAPSTAGTDAFVSLISKKPKKPKKDLWTRWPLLLDDMPIPEWTLEDEVRSLAFLFFKSQDLENGVSTPEEEEEDEDIRLPPSASANLTLVAADFLSHILAMISSSIPKAEKSMVNRFKPISWEDVLMISGISGRVDVDTLETVHNRLVRIYGPTSSRAVERLRSATTTRETLSEICASADADLLSLSNLPTVKHTMRKRKRGKYKLTGKYKRRKLATTSEFVEDDGTQEPESVNLNH